MAHDEATGTLTSGGVFRITPAIIEVTYPDDSKPPVTIDLAEIDGVERTGSDLTLTRRDGRQVGLRTSSLKEAADVEVLIRAVLESGIDAAFVREVSRLHAQGFRVIAAGERMAQMARRKRANLIIGAIPVVLAAIAAAAYAGYYLSLSEADALEMMDETDAVLVLLVGLAPLLFYLSYLLSRREETVLVVVNENNQVVRRM